MKRGGAVSIVGSGEEKKKKGGGGGVVRPMGKSDIFSKKRGRGGGGVGRRHISIQPWPRSDKGEREQMVYRISN